MKRYIFTIPIAGYLAVTVEADSEDAARDDAIDAANDYLSNIELPDEPNVGICELEVYPVIVEGNICHVGCNRIAIEDVTEIEEEEGTNEPT